MDRVYFLNSYIESAQGNLEETIKRVTQGNIDIGHKSVHNLNGDIEVPYYHFKNSAPEDPQSIFNLLKESAKKAILPLDESEKKRTALIVGTSLADFHLINIMENIILDKKQKYLSEKRSIDTYARLIAKELGLNDFTMTINTACTSSVNAIIEGSNLIKSGIFDHIVVAGVEIFSKMTTSGFNALSMLSTDTIKPFDKNRDGLILGEGVSSILLGKEKSPWSLKGAYSNCNSKTVTSVGSNGTEYVDVMKKALENAQIDAKDITAIKAHATGTESNDLAEINAMTQVFDESIRFTALKPYLGHTLGVCGALEIALFMKFIDNGLIPKTIGCNEPIIEKYRPISEDFSCSNGLFMCNYFGFGGNNTSIILQRV